MYSDWHRLENYSINCIQILPQMNLATGIVFFFICGYISSVVFKSIQQQIPSNANTLLLQKSLFHYSSACEIVDAINTFFGWICLPAITFCTVGLINISLFIFEFFFYGPIFFLILYIMHLVIVIWTADNINYQVKK